MATVLESDILCFVGAVQNSASTCLNFFVPRFSNDNLVGKHTRLMLIDFERSFSREDLATAKASVDSISDFDKLLRGKIFDNEMRSDIQEAGVEHEMLHPIY